MKALTLTQPWASAVALGLKAIETRSWHTGYRGEIAIHAAKGMPRDAIAFAQSCRFLPRPYRYPRGAVIALAMLQSCCPTETLTGAGGLAKLDPRELALGDFAPGRFAWLLSNVVVLPVPLPARGSLGLWKWDRDAAPA